LKCLDNNKYLGTDGTTAGSAIYSNKSGTDTKHYWSFKLYKQAVITSTLDPSITVTSTNDNSIFAYAANSAIYLKGIVESSNITICNMIGQIISTTTYNGPVYKRELGSGSYIVSIVSQNHRKSMVVYVR